VWRLVRVPEPEWEDRRQLERERGQLLGERNRHRNRLGSKLGWFVETGLVPEGARLQVA